jgi:tetratricopeptide (TPR) repeat protein
VGLDEDHISIAKPREWDAQQCEAARDLLRAVVGSSSADAAALKKSHDSASACHNLPQMSLGSLFKGRDSILQDLREKLKQGASCEAVITANQTIAGMGGVGKTRLALEYAWQYSSEYSARLYVKADSRSSLRQNVAELANTLDVPTSNNIEDQLREVLKWLHTNARWLLILDNVDTQDAKDAVLDLLPQLTNGHVLITSRLTTWAETSEQIELDVLSEPAAVEFLLDRTVKKRRATATDATDAATLARLLGYLPLALEQAGAFIAKNAITFGDYIQRWQSREEKVLGWNKDLLGRYDRSVLTTWAVTFDQLDTDGQGLLHLLCWLAPDPIPVDLIKKQTHTAGTEPIDSESGIANLVDFSFLKRSEDKQSVSMHRLVQEIAQRQLPQENKGIWLQRSLRMLNAFCSVDPEDVRTWPAIYTPARPHLSHILPSADKAGIADLTARLMNVLAIYFEARADFTAAEPLYRRALSIDETIYGPDHPNVARDLNNLAELLRATNRHSEAEPLYRRALKISDTSYGPDHPKVAIGLNNLAALLRATNRHTEAEPLYRRALSIDEASYGPDHPTVAIGLNNLALLLKATNRHSEAETLYRRALSIDETSYGPDHPEVASVLNNLANLLCATNRVSEAEPLSRRMVEIFVSITQRTGRVHPHLEEVVQNYVAMLQSLGFDSAATESRLSKLLKPLNPR